MKQRTTNHQKGTCVSSPCPLPNSARARAAAVATLPEMTVGRQISSYACAACRRAKSKCSEEKPCRRCIRANRAASCAEWGREAGSRAWPSDLVLLDPATAGKRRRITISESCASCRRSKVRCDEQKPCTRCVKQGQAETCVSWRRSGGKNLETLHPGSLMTGFSGSPCLPMSLLETLIPDKSPNSVVASLSPLVVTTSAPQERQYDYGSRCQGPSTACNLATLPAESITSPIAPGDMTQYKKDSRATRKGVTENRCSSILGDAADSDVTSNCFDCDWPTNRREDPDMEILCLLAEQDAQRCELFD
jgi:hypothetical protein